MKVLYYVEPFPIRDAWTQHDWVAGAWSWYAISTGFDAQTVRFFCNDPVADRIRGQYAEKGVAYDPDLFATPSAAFTAVLREFAAKPWAEGGMANWRDLILGQGIWTEALQIELKRLHAEVFPFEAVAHWGPNAAVRKFCFDQGLGYVAAEAGATRTPFPNAVYLDPLGCHGATMPANAGGALSGASQTPGIDRIRAGLGVTVLPRTPTRRAMVALQLADDANSILSRSGWTPKQFVAFAAPKLLEAGYAVTVKGHPGAVHRPLNQSAQDEALAFASGQLGCETLTVTPTETPYQDWLRGFDLISSMSSSISFEAALCGVAGTVEESVSYAPAGAFPTLDEALAAGLATAGPGEATIQAVAFYLGRYALYGQEEIHGAVQEAAAFTVRAREHRHDPAGLLRAWDAAIGISRADAFERAFSGV